MSATTPPVLRRPKRHRQPGRFAVIRDAMKGKGMVGLGHVVLSKRERPIILVPYGKGLRAMTLRYP